MRTEFYVLNEARGVTLTAYLQGTGGEFGALTERPAMLVIPGGGYHFCSDREADPVAFPYLKAGYHAFVLRYSLNEQAEWPHPLDDYEQSMDFILDHAEAWHVAADRIAVIGFSAGGHLAGCAATMAKRRPAAAILGYPVMDGACAHDYLASAPDVPSAVTPAACPCFVFATRTDNLVPVENALHMADALCRNDVAFECHIYGNGPHGLSTGDASINHMPFSACYADWVKDSLSWLEDVVGGLGPQGLSAPRFGARINGDHDATLSIDCTLARLKRSPEARKALEECLPGKDVFSSAPSAALHVITLRSGLAYAGLTPELVNGIDARLRTIANRED